MASLMLLIESLERVASSSKPDTSCPTSVSLTADPAVILSLSPPPLCVLPSKIHHPQQREHQAGEGQDCNDDVLQNWRSTRKAPDRSDPKQCKQSKSKGQHHISKASPGQVWLSIVSHLCDVNWGELDGCWSQGKIQFNRINLKRRVDSTTWDPLSPRRFARQRQSQFNCELLRDEGACWGGSLPPSASRGFVSTTTQAEEMNRSSNWFFFVFFAPAQNLSDGSGPSTWAPS